MTIQLPSVPEIDEAIGAFGVATTQTTVAQSQRLEANEKVLALLGQVRTFALNVKAETAWPCNGVGAHDFTLGQRHAICNRCCKVIGL